MFIFLRGLLWGSKMGFVASSWGTSGFRVLCVSLRFFWHCKVDEVLTKVSFCIFKNFTFLNLERAPTWAVPGLFVIVCTWTNLYESRFLKVFSLTSFRFQGFRTKIDISINSCTTNCSFCFRNHAFLIPIEKKIEASKIRQLMMSNCRSALTENEWKAHSKKFSNDIFYRSSQKKFARCFPSLRSL